MALSLHLLDIHDLRQLLAEPAAFERDNGCRIEPGALPPERVLVRALEQLSVPVPPPGPDADRGAWPLDPDEATPPWLPLLGTCLYLLDGDLVVGAGGVKAPPNAAGQVEIGYGVAPAFQGCGIGTEGARLLVASCVGRGVRSVLANTRPDNAPSQRLLQRLGFVRDGEQPDPEDGVVWRWVRTLAREPA